MASSKQPGKALWLQVPGRRDDHGSTIRWSGRCFISGGSSSEAGRMGALDSNPMGCTGPSPLE